MTTSVASKASWKTVARRLLIGWLFTVAGVTIYEWYSLPRPSGYFVDAVEPNTGEFHASGKTKLTKSDLDTEIARVRQLFDPPRTPTASERLFARDKNARDSQLNWDLPPDVKIQRWDEILKDDVPSSDITDPSVRNTLLAEATGLPVESVAKNPEGAMRLVKLFRLALRMARDPFFADRILDPEFNALSQPAVPRLRLVQFLIATVTPMVFLVVLLPLRRSKEQLPARETNSETFGNRLATPANTDIYIPIDPKTAKTLDEGLNVLSDVSTTLERNEIIATPLAGPWRRFWARIIDISLLSLPVTSGLVIVLIAVDPAWGSWFQKPSSGITFNWLCLPAVLLAEAIVFGVFGNTPGKALLGLRVTTVGGISPSFDDYLSRLLGVYWFGLGTGFPIVSLFTMHKQYQRLKLGREARYDSGRFNVRGHKLGFVRVALAAVVVFLLLVMIPGMLAELARKA